MGRQQHQVALVLALAVGLAGCSSGAAPVTPSNPPAGGPAVPVPTPSTETLLTVTNPGTGFSTTDLYDAEDRVVRITRDEIIFPRDDTRVRGYRLAHIQSYPAYFIVREPCVGEECWPWLEVRFGIQAGQPRAYLTADYGHDNPGTLVSLAVVDGIISVRPTDRFPPGTPTLSGLVTEMRESGPIPVVGAEVYLHVTSGYRGTVTDGNGFYQIHGLIKGAATKVVALKPGYQTENIQLTIDGDMSLDVQLVRQ